jgi:hypothetical protein
MRLMRDGTYTWNDIQFDGIGKASGNSSNEVDFATLYSQTRLFEGLTVHLDKCSLFYKQGPLSHALSLYNSLALATDGQIILERFTSLRAVCEALTSLTAYPSKVFKFQASVNQDGGAVTGADQATRDLQVVGMVKP